MIVFVNRTLPNKLSAVGPVEQQVPVIQQSRLNVRIVFRQILEVGIAQAPALDISHSQHGNTGSIRTRFGRRTVLDEIRQLLNRRPRPPLRQIRQVRRIRGGRLLVLAPPLFLRFPTGAALGQDALQQNTGRFVVAALGPGQLRLGGDQASLAGGLEDAGPAAFQVGLRPLQRFDRGIQPGKLLLNLGNNAALLGEGGQDQRNRSRRCPRNFLESSTAAETLYYYLGPEQVVVDKTGIHLFRENKTLEPLISRHRLRRYGNIPYRGAGTEQNSIFRQETSAGTGESPVCDVPRPTSNKLIPVAGQVGGSDPGYFPVLKIGWVRGLGSATANNGGGFADFQPFPGRRNIPGIGHGYSDSSVETSA